MSSDLPVDLIRHLLPGFGFFSPSGPLRLRVQVKQVLRRVRLEYLNDTPTSFVVPTFEFAGPDGKIDKGGLIQTVTLPDGSDLRPDALRDKIVRGTPFRTAKVARPAVDIFFTEPQQITRINMASRLGDPSQATARFRLLGFHQTQEVFRHDNMSDDRYRDALDRIAARMSFDTAELAGMGPDAARTHLLQKVTVRLDAAHDAFAPRMLFNLLPVFDRDATLDPLAERLIAAALAKLLTPSGIVSTTTLAPLRWMLDSPAKIEKVIAGANVLLSAQEGREVRMMPGKHAIQEAQLVRRKDAYLAALDAVFPALRACGVTPMLAYGSLLGAVREGGFLAHDDDVDILYHDGSTSREEALSRRAALVAKMEAHGFRMPKGFRNENFHLTNGDVNLDLFPCWSDGVGLQVMRKYPSYEALDDGVILPASETALYGHSYPAPARKEAFLEWRYGSGWSTPDPYHEWPWGLER